MGKETTTIVRIDGAARRCAVALEPGELIIGRAIAEQPRRGASTPSAPAKRVLVPLASMSALDARAGVLRFRATGVGQVEIELGDKAKAWLDAIKNPRSRVQKLGVTPGQRICVLGSVEDGVEEELAAASGQAPTHRLAKGVELVFFFAREPEELERLGAISNALAPGGAAWTLWPKGRKDFAHEDVVAGAKAAGLVQTRSIGFSPVYSGLRLVRPAKR